MTPEDHLTQVLQAEASQIDPDTQWADVERGLAARRRGRRVRQAALSTLAAAALVAGVLAVVAIEDDRESGLRVVPPATQPTVEVTTTTSAQPTTVPVGTPPVPQTVVVQRGNGEIAELSSADGRTVRVLLPAYLEAESRLFVGVVSMTAARDAVYTERDGRIHRVDMRSGAVRDSGAGWNPAVSPDGTQLAYVVESGKSVGGDRLIVRDLASGQERRWDAEPPGPNRLATVLSRIDWAPDSRHLAMELGWEDALDVAVFDTDEPVLRPMSVEQGKTVYSDPVYQGASSSLVVLANDDADYSEPTPNRIVSIDTATGQITATLVDQLVGHPTGSDSSGQHLLYIRANDDAYVLYRLSDGKSVRIASDVVAADW